MYWGKAIAVWVINDDAVNVGVQGGSSDDEPLTAGMYKTFN
jgi:hypothetical protein